MLIFCLMLILVSQQVQPYPDEWNEFIFISSERLKCWRERIKRRDCVFQEGRACNNIPTCEECSRQCDHSFEVKLSVRLVNFMGKDEIVGSTRIEFDFNKQSADTARCRSLSFLSQVLCESVLVFNDCALLCVSSILIRAVVDTSPVALPLTMLSLLFLCLTHA